MVVDGIINKIFDILEVIPYQGQWRQYKMIKWVERKRNKCNLQFLAVETIWNDETGLKETNIMEFPVSF